MKLRASLLGRPDDAHGVPVGLVLEGHLHSEIVKDEGRIGSLQSDEAFPNR